MIRLKLSKNLTSICGSYLKKPVEKKQGKYMT